jgi:hypothetical protein
MSHVYDVQTAHELGLLGRRIATLERAVHDLGEALQIVEGAVDRLIAMAEGFEE